MSNPEKPNLDLIRMVQQARMEHDADAVPSQVGGVYWIETKPQQATQQPTARAGAWVLTTDTQHVDALWAKVKAATEAGTLGYKSKVSTASPAGSSAREIHVCTYDRDDSADVERVRQVLETFAAAIIGYR